MIFSTNDLAKYTGKTQAYINRILNGNLLKDLELKPTKVGDIWIFSEEDALKLAQRYSPDKGYVELKTVIELQSKKV
jgi:hypothetical protein